MVKFREFDVELLLSSLNIDTLIVNTFRKDIEEIKKALSLMEDEHSRYVFLSEILCWSLGSISYQKDDKYFSGADVTNQIPEETLWEKQKDFFSQYKKYNLQMPRNADGSIEKAAIKAIYTTFKAEQYLYQNESTVIGPNKDDVCLDLGGYIADTAIWLLNEKRVKKVYCFEPQKQIADLALLNIKNLELEDKCEIVRKLVSNFNGIAHMQEMESNSSAARIINNEGKYKQKYGNKGIIEGDIGVVTIDSFCKDNKIQPSFIKMDIEGAEIDALNGAINTIAKNKPLLAVCLYHKPTDLYKIPLLIRSIRSDYKFYIKKSSTLIENVLFAY